MRSTPDTLVESILRLRRAEQMVDARVREEIRPVRELLEDLVGRTVRPAYAARMLGISHPALLRWMDKGEIATVTTPEGRREIPLSEVLGLVEDIERMRDQEVERPVAAVIRDRERRARETIDPDRLLPPRKRGHRTAELQSLAYHRAVAERLDDELVHEARRRVARWRADERIDPRWADEWEALLSKPLVEIGRAISSDSQRARTLRQTSPFAGVLNEQERRRLVRAVEARG